MHDSIISTALVLALTGSTAAQSWLDNFNDGSAVDGAPVTWVASPAFAAEFVVTDGDMVVSMPVGVSPAISSPRVPVNFEAGASVRARMLGQNGPGRYTIALADEPTGIQGYVASFNTCGGGMIELFRGDVLGKIHQLGGGPLPMPYSPLEEFIVQLDVFDGVVSARIWKPGEPFPEPQLWENDDTYAAGVASIAIQDFGGGTCTGPGDVTDVAATIRYMQASPTPLTHSDIGDLDADGDVDFSDLLNLLAAWGACESPCAEDLDDSGAVGFADLLLLLSNWS